MSLANRASLIGVLGLIIGVAAFPSEPRLVGALEPEPAVPAPSAVQPVVTAQTAQVGEPKPDQRFEYEEPHLGTTVRLVIYAGSEELADEAARGAFARVRELNSRLSDYDADSELNEFCRRSGSGQAVPVSDDLWAVLVRAEELARASDGAFDISLGPLIRLWRKARRERQLPTLDARTATQECCGFRFVRLDREKQTVELLKPRMQLDLGGIGKGFIAQRVREFLADRGLKRVLVGLGGDLSLGEPPPGKTSWRIAVSPFDDPETPEPEVTLVLGLTHAAISTSGDVFQFVEIDGQRYSHIVDPKTGLGLTDRFAVTVVAADGGLADGLATAISVLGQERGFQLLKQYPGTEAIAARLVDGQIKTTETAGFERWRIPPAKPEEPRP